MTALRGDVDFRERSFVLVSLMAFSPTFLSRHCVLCQCTGTIDYDTFVELFEELFRQHGPLAGAALFCDLRGCNSTLDFKSEIRITTYMQAHLPLLSGARWAFFTDSMLIYGLARMGQILTSDLPFHVSVFQNPEAAADWLGWHGGVRETLQRHLEPGWVVSA